MTRKLDASAWAAREEARAANRLAWASDPRNAAVSRERALVLKSQERAANRDAWSRNPVNTNREREETLAAVVPVAAPAVSVDNTSLGKLRQIMADTAAPLYQRLNAAETIVPYDLAPASLVDVPSEQVAVASFRFLRAVVDEPSTPQQLKFRALKCLVAIESSRAAARQSAGEQIAKRELARRLGKDAEWAAGSWSWPPSDVARRLDAARAKHRLSQQR